MVIFTLIVISCIGECLIKMEEILTSHGVRDTSLVVRRLRVIINLGILSCLRPNMNRGCVYLDLEIGSWKPCRDRFPLKGKGTTMSRHHPKTAILTTLFVLKQVG